MALAAFGKPTFKKEFDNIIEFIPPYNFKLNLKYFVHHKQLFFESSTMSKPIFDNLYSIEIEKLLGSRRNYNEEILQKHFDIAASLQFKFEEIR